MTEVAVSLVHTHTHINTLYRCTEYSHPIVTNNNSIMFPSLRFTAATVLLLVLSSLLHSSTTTDAAKNTCPRIPTVQDLDIEKYVEKSWFVHRQQITSYQSAEDLYCVTATYSIEGQKQWFQDAITVNNYANTGGVNEGSGGPFALCATRRDPVNEPAKLRVAPCFLPSILGGDYWVTAVDDKYEWAIVVAGQPTVEGNCGEWNLCTTPEPGFIPNPGGNGEGLWFLTRDSKPDIKLLEHMEAVATDLGICVERMEDVVHDGCKYEGAGLKK